MYCADATPTDGFGWAVVADCLRDDLPYAAQVAWERAIDADPSLGARAIDSVRSLAHVTGDDRLLLRLAPQPPYDRDSVWLTDEDLAGHVAYAAATPGSPGEEAQLATIGERACRYASARYRLAGLRHVDGEYKAEVAALREALTAPPPAGAYPAVALDHLRAGALLQVAAVYSTIDRMDVALDYARMLPRRLSTAPYATYLHGWSYAARGEPRAARTELRAVARVLPEASALIIATQLDEDGRRAETDAAYGYWSDVRTDLARFLDRWEFDPAGAADAPLPLPRAAALAAAGLAPASAGIAREEELEREWRRTRLDPVGRALVEEARAQARELQGEAVLDLAARLVARIDRALADPVAAPHLWRWDDFGG